MELRQLRYFVRTVEFESIGRAALDLGLAQSALSQQISRLEGELCTRLLKRTARGTLPTEAGIAFFAEAQLTLRHADQAIRVAQRARLSGTVSIGLTPTTAAVLALPFMRAMRTRYPDLRLHMVESLSGHLTSMLEARTIDLAVLFNAHHATPWSMIPLLEERLMLIRGRHHMNECARPDAACVDMVEVANESLILPTGAHGLRRAVDAAFLRARVRPRLVAEIDSLSMLMESVDAGFGATVQPGAALGRYADASSRFHVALLSDPEARRRSAVASLDEDELSPVALAARIVLIDTAGALVRAGHWPGASLADRDLEMTLSPP